MFNFLKFKEKPKAITKNQEQVKEIEFQLRDFEGEVHKAKSKELVDALSDPEFIKVFGFPSDMQNAILKENLFSDTEQLKHELAFLQEFFKSEEKPLYALLRFSSFLRTIVGERVGAFSSLPKEGNFSQQEKERLDYLYTAFSDLEQDPETPYLLAKNVGPSYLMKAYQPFEKWRESVAPVYIDKQYAVIDNGQNTFQILRIPEEERAQVEKLIEQYQKQMEAMQVSHRPPQLPENASLAEMQAYKKKYLDHKIHQDMQWGIPHELEDYVLPLREQVKLFPHLKNEMEFFTDETVFEARSFFKKDVRELIEKDLNIDLTKLSFQEQIYFLTTVAKEKNRDFQRIKDFSQQFGEDGLRTFLSVAHAGKKMGEHILHIGERIEEDAARKIFAQYTELIRASQHIIESDFTDHIDDETFQQYLLKRGVRWLQSFDNEQLTERQLLRKLENSRKEILVKGQLVKYLSKHVEGFRLEDFSEHFALEMKKSSELSEEEKQQHLELYEVLRDHYNEETKTSVVEYYRKKLEEENQTLLDVYDKKEEKLIGSIRVGELENGNLEIASLMVDYPYEHVDLGSLVFEKAVQLFSDRTLEGRVLKGKEWLLDYYGRFGFRVGEESEDDGVPAYCILRGPSSSES